MNLTLILRKICSSKDLELKWKVHKKDHQTKIQHKLMGEENGRESLYYQKDNLKKFLNNKVRS
jgi:hypothetical protein